MQQQQQETEEEKKQIELVEDDDFNIGPLNDTPEERIAQARSKFDRIDVYGLPVFDDPGTHNHWNFASWINLLSFAMARKQKREIKRTGRLIRSNYELNKKQIKILMKKIQDYGIHKLKVNTNPGFIDSEKKFLISTAEWVKFQYKLNNKEEKLKQWTKIAKQNYKSIAEYEPTAEDAGMSFYLFILFVCFFLFIYFFCLLFFIYFFLYI